MMTPIVDFNVWDIVKVPFPYTNRLVQQLRPAFVVGRAGGSDAPELLWVSASHRGWRGDVTVSDLALAGLPAPSIVRTAKIATIDAEKAGRIGTLPKSERDVVCNEVRTVFAHCLRS